MLPVPGPRLLLARRSVRGPRRLRVRRSVPGLRRLRVRRNARGLRLLRARLRAEPRRPLPPVAVPTHPRRAVVAHRDPRLRHELAVAPLHRAAQVVHEARAAMTPDAPQVHAVARTQDAPQHRLALLKRVAQVAVLRDLNVSTIQAERAASLRLAAPIARRRIPAALASTAIQTATQAPARRASFASTAISRPQLSTSQVPLPRAERET